MLNRVSLNRVSQGHLHLQILFCRWLQGAEAELQDFDLVASVFATSQRSTTICKTIYSQLTLLRLLQMEAIAIRLEVIASRLEAIPIRLEAIAIRMEAILRSSKFKSQWQVLQPAYSTFFLCG